MNLKTTFMKRITFLLICLLPVLRLFSQEFPIYNNGFIYSRNTMQKLQYIVDSLNLKFRRCELNRKYFSVKQGKGIVLSVEGKKARKALNDIKSGISLENFIEQYAVAKNAEPDLLVIFEYINDDGQSISNIRIETLNEQNEIVIELGDEEKNGEKGREGNWVYDYSYKTKYSNESVELIYIHQEPVANELPEKYARMIQYTHCMIDTSQNVFLKTASYHGGWYRDENNDEKEKVVHYREFMRYVENQTKNITELYKIDTSAEDHWFLEDSCRWVFIRENLSKEKKFMRLLEAAVTEVLENNSFTNDEFEKFTAEFYSKKDALTMKRNRKIMGQCSMDQSPRYHAMSIAVLAAETISWEVFLRAHLDIMNDRFERASDGSYAWAGRGTYIKEIEELNIEIQELLLGISLRISDAPQNHYYGSIGRLGRALAETKNRQQLEEQLLSMIGDNRLDDYNRMMMHYLFLNYTYYLPLKEDRLNNLKKLEEADRLLPDYMKFKIKINKENFERENS
jgi:hypothetical protein